MGRKIVKDDDGKEQVVETDSIFGIEYEVNRRELHGKDDFSGTKETKGNNDPFTSHDTSKIEIGKKDFFPVIERGNMEIREESGKNLEVENIIFIQINQKEVQVQEVQVLVHLVLEEGDLFFLEKMTAIDFLKKFLSFSYRKFFYFQTSISLKRIIGYFIATMICCHTEYFNKCQRFFFE